MKPKQMRTAREQPKSQTRRKEKTKQRNRERHTSQFAVDTTVSSLNILHLHFLENKREIFKKKDITTKKDEQAEQQTTEGNRQEVTRVLYSERTMKCELQPVYTFNIS